MFLPAFEGALYDAKPQTPEGDVFLAIRVKEHIALVGYHLEREGFGITCRPPSEYNIASFDDPHEVIVSPIEAAHRVRELLRNQSYTQPKSPT